MELVSKIIFIITGITLLILNLHYIAKKKMDIAIGSWWTVMSVIVIVFGAVFDFNSLLRMVNARNLILIYFFVIALVIALYIYGMYITSLRKKTDEIVMWVSYAKSLKSKQSTSDKPEENSTDTDKKTQ